MFNHQDDIQEYAAKVNDTMLIDYIATLVSKNLKIDKATFVKEIVGKFSELPVPLKILRSKLLV